LADPASLVVVTPRIEATVEPRMAVQFSTQALEEYERVLAQYPLKRAAIMPVLWIAQREFGYLSPEVQQYVADLMGFPLAWVSGVASFYTMYYKKPIGKYHIQVCTNVSCMLRGSDEIVRAVEERLGKRPPRLNAVEEEKPAATALLPHLDQPSRTRSNSSHSKSSSVGRVGCSWLL
jgi:NADH:ubiquinone oxidoreductase subunit E